MFYSKAEKSSVALGLKFFRKKSAQENTWT